MKPLRTGREGLGLNREEEDREQTWKRKGNEGSEDRLKRRNKGWKQRCITDMSEKNKSMAREECFQSGNQGKPDFFSSKNYLYIGKIYSVHIH